MTKDHLALLQTRNRKSILRSGKGWIFSF